MRPANHPSVIELSKAYFEHHNQPFEMLPNWHFCDNEADANDCLDLVLAGVKKATSPSLWWYKANNIALPQVGDLNIVTDWHGYAHCIVKTTKVTIVPFNLIDDTYAALEGEGDKSLAYWRQVHWAYYQRELAETKYTPSHDMPIVCEEFEIVFTLEDK
ncbi:ASCH domain-containing protein [Pseudoalteromonas obscura]|uniref:ASCH domain-containing protein n=1 Tax=Pseudoalteromonas obscura TaxID=3048491 RepID=A0ABT7EF67_9GAMM|nr:ASCH domain-containing protein [Pseudoalteromonas sp. P94(2023)]MDK2593917.1 ASCH domain-containing protein [Pseudoalteromonas sp. P94(2023)]